MNILLYVLSIILGLEFTVLFWVAISRTPKKKITKPNYCASADDKLSYGLKLF